MNGTLSGDRQRCDREDRRYRVPILIGERFLFYLVWSGFTFAQTLFSRVSFCRIFSDQTSLRFFEKCSKNTIGGGQWHAIDELQLTGW